MKIGSKVKINLEVINANGNRDLTNKEINNLQKVKEETFEVERIANAPYPIVLKSLPTFFKVEELIQI